MASNRTAWKSTTLVTSIVSLTSNGERYYKKIPKQFVTLIKVFKLSIYIYIFILHTINNSLEKTPHSK